MAADILASPPNTVERDYYHFPSQFVDPNIKKQKEWCMEYTKAFHADAKSMPTEMSLFRNNANYSRYRQYARGEQSQDQYKELLGLQKNQGKLNTSYRNLDFSIFKIAPKLKNVVVANVLNQPLKINVKMIDAQSLNDRRADKNKLLEFVINQEQVERFERLTKMGLEKPTQPGVPPPTSIQQIDPYLDMHPKNMMAMEVKDYLTLDLSLNDWPQLSTELVSDVYDTGVMAIRPYIDSNGVIKLRKGTPERMITNKCVYPDFRDVIRVGEYHEMTIADLKQKTQGRLGEDTYKQIANMVAGKTRSAYTGAVDLYWSDMTYTYAYDREKITVLEATWFSVDKDVNVEEKNRFGNPRLRKKGYNYVPYAGHPNDPSTLNGGKGVSDEEYSKMNNGTKTIIRKEIKNVYQCTWIVDTNVAFDFGLSTNMARASKSLADVELPWIISTTDFMSTVGNIESPLDQFQLNWLQFQSHIASSKPPGIAIEKKALSRIGITGQAGKKWDPKEDLVMYAETGNIVFDGYDDNGNPLPWLPIKDMPNGLSPAAMEHFNIMLQMLEMMRTVLGINSLVEGQQPAERLGKGVAQISLGASENALSYISNTYKRFYEKVCNHICLLIPNAMEFGQVEGFGEALGLESFRFFNINKDIGLRDMGITIEAGPDDALREKISQICQIAVEKGQMMPEDAIAIELEDNPMRALLMIRKHRLEYEERQAQLGERQMAAEGQKNQMAAKAATDGKIAEAKMQAQADAVAALQQAQFDENAKEKDFIRQTILMKLEHGYKLNEMEQQVIDNVIEIHAKGNVELKKAMISANSKKEKVEA